MSLIKSYYNNHEEADDSSTVFDEDTVVPDEVPSLSLPPQMPTSTATSTATDYHNQKPNINESTSSISIQEESPANTIPELLLRVNSTRTQHRLAMPSPSTITTASNSSSHQSTKRPRQRRSSRLKRQQKQDQSYEDEVTSDSENEDENGLEDYEPDEAVINQSSSSQTSSTKDLTKHEFKWRSKFEKLCVYKQLYGHTSVPQRSQDYRDLGVWVSNQRRQYYKLKKKNGKAKINLKRIEMLNSIGFEWVVANNAYKEKHGHTNVSSKSKGKNKQLGAWSHNQRTAYKKFKENKKSQITSKRIEMLESIGFQWDCRRGPAPRS